MKNLKQVRKIKLVFLLLFLNYNLYSQNTSNIIKVTGVAGSAYINERITPKEAKEEALKDAQRNALKKAGISEFLQSSIMLITDSKNEKNSDFLSSEFQSHLEGAILDYQVIASNTIQTKDNLLLVSVLIDATIIKYDTKPDLNFDVKLFGIKNVYNNPEKINFSIKASIDCYLYLFSFIEDEASLMYPNINEKEQLLKKDTTYFFPVGKVDYILTADNKRSEKGRLICVFTKSPMKYIQMNDEQITTPESIYSWINSIPLDQKKIITNPILIQY
jgi:hypothetical protein